MPLVGRAPGTGRRLCLICIQGDAILLDAGMLRPLQSMLGCREACPAALVGMASFPPWSAQTQPKPPLQTFESCLSKVRAQESSLWLASGPALGLSADARPPPLSTDFRTFETFETEQ